MENFETYRLDQTGQQTQAILDQVSTNTADIAQLRALYEALTQSEPVIIQPADTWPVADPQENVIYRVIDRVNTPPQSYSDYMWNGTAMVLMATYNNAIDNEPTPGSNSLVKSGGVAASIVFDISAYHATGSTLATYANLAAALGTDGANVPASVRKGGMSVKFVKSSDNKYVQYRLMTTSFSTDENDWQSNESLYENNFEFVEAHKDKDGRFLYGVDKENDFIFGCGIPSVIRKKCNYITVDKHGKGDYGTLTGAVANAKDGDTIIVMPGVYENESAKAGDKKTLYIIGIDREKCIIKNNSGDYYTPPLQFSGGLIRNLTIIAEASTGDSYCVHMDFHNETNNTIDIENCTFINNGRLGALGIGLRGGCVLTIRNCLVSAPNGGRALLCHDNDYNDPQYEGLQTLKVYDSVLYCPDAAVFIQGQGNVSRDFSVSQYYIEFVRNRVKGNVAFINWYEQPQLGEITQDDYQGVKNLRLSNISWGNSASVLNNE